MKRQVQCRSLFSSLVIVISRLYSSHPTHLKIYLAIFCYENNIRKEIIKNRRYYHGKRCVNVRRVTILIDIHIGNCNRPDYEFRGFLRLLITFIGQTLFIPASSVLKLEDFELYFETRLIEKYPVKADKN